MLLFLIGLQDPASQGQVKPPVVRKIRPKMTGSYSVEVTSIGSQIARYTYVMRFSIVTLPKLPNGAPAPTETGTLMHFVLEQLKSTVGDREETKPLFGVIDSYFEEAGFPKQLTFQGRTLPFSIPVLSFYLPQTPGETLEVRSPLYDGAIEAVGKSFVKMGKEMKVDLQMNFHIREEKPDQSMYRKYRSTAFFDPSDGDLLRSEGKYTAPDGTVNFRMKQLP